MSSVSAPIFMVTGESSQSDKIKGLDCGADDYIVKPFDVCELLARARALLRRGKSSPAVLRVGDLELDPSTRCARRVERAIPLSAREYALLEYLMRNPGRVLTRSMILSHVWDIDYDGSDNVLDVYISYLRAKIGRGYLHTVRGVGYRLEAADL
jgi:DNA-binding response OmpR family regulator